MLLRYSLPQYHGTAVLPASTYWYGTGTVVPGTGTSWYQVPRYLLVPRYHGTSCTVVPGTMVPYHGSSTNLHRRRDLLLQGSS